MGTQVNNRLSGGKNHVSPEGLAVWLNRSAPAEEEDPVLEHLIHCAACREEMVMICQATQSDTPIEPGPEFDNLLRIGELAAAEVWCRRQALAQTPDRRGWRQWFTFRQPALRWAAAAVLLLAVIIPVYRFYRSNQPIERAMESLRQTWSQSRPLEGRVTGGFPYLPYQVTRGGDDLAPVNQNQLTAATAELAREVIDRPSPRAWHAMGRLHLLKGEFDRAEELLKQALDAEPRNAQAHVDLALSLYERGVREESLPLLSQAAGHLKTATEIEPQLAEAWFNLALCHEQMMLLSQAQTDWERFLELDGSSPWASEARARLQKLRGRSRLVTPESSTAADELLAAEEAGDEVKIRQLLAEKFSEVTTVAWGRFLDAYLKAIGAGNQSEASKYRRILQHLAELIRDGKNDHYYVDQFAFVSRSDTARLNRIRQLRDALAQAEQRYRTGDYSRAVKFFTQARTAAEKIGDQCHSEAAMYGIAKIYTPQTETAATSTIRQRLVVVAAGQRHMQMQAWALATLANQHGAQQMASQSLAKFSAASEIAQRIGDSDSAIYSLRNIVGAFNYVGQPEASYRNSYFILQLLRKHTANLRNNCASYADLAERFAASDDYPRAIDYQREALQFCERGNKGAYVYELSRAADYYSRNSQQDLAAELLNQAIGIANTYISETGMQSLLFALHLHLGEVLLRQGKSKEAEAAYRTAMSAIAKSGHERFLVEISYGLARAYLQQGRINEAETTLAESIALDERTLININEVGGKSNFIESRLDGYRTMVGLQYFQKHASAQAFDYAEKYRSRELLDVLSIYGVSARPANGVIGRSQPLRLDQVQRSMPARAQLLTYAITERHLLIWLVTSTDWQVVSVPITPARLQAIVADFLNKLRDPDEIRMTNVLAHDLYRLLIEPLAGKLSGQRTLVIVPDGVLQALPFSALRSPAGDYLIEEYELSYSPSSSVFLEMARLGREKKSAMPGSLLVVSNPKFDRQLYPNLKWLPGTEQEAAGLRSFYPVSFQLSRAQATKQALIKEMGKYEVVHLATHSIVNEQNPLYSAIILAAAGQPDARIVAAREGLAGDALQAREVFGLRFARTRLVILSSCRPSTSEQLHRNSFGTLAQAFFSAQVPAVINSLWDVDDSSTAKLMQAFHRAYRREGNNVSQALRRAQLSLLRGDNEKWRRPYYWAAFLISGDGLLG